MKKHISTWLMAASQKLPYYARAIAALTPVEKDIRPPLAGADGKPHPPTIGVDKRWRLYWTPEALERIEGEGSEPAAVIQHEVEHLLREHHARRGAREAPGWLVCSDAEINDDLPGLCNCIRPSSLPTPQADGETAEFYYDNLPLNDESTKGCGGGSGVDGVERDYEAPDTGEGAVGAVQEHETGRLLDAVASDVLEHAKRGTVPDSARVWAEARKRPVKVDWREMVRSSIRRSTASVQGSWDYTYRRMHRHQAPRAAGSRQVLHPGQQRPAPDVDVIVDTSGSVGSYGDLIAGTLDSVRRTAQGSVRVISCDAEVHDKVPLKSWRVVQTLHGGGGTDLRLAFEQVTAPIVVVLTDCETPWPETKPAAHVVVVRYGSQAPAPSWARLIHVDPS